MKAKYAAISLSNEKAWIDGKLVYHYSLPSMTREEVEAVGEWYYALCVRLIEKAAAEGARLVCLPENTIEINKWLKVQELPLRLEAARRNWERFQTVFSEVARACGVVVVACTNEPNGDVLHNAAGVFDERGNYLGSYRKVQLTPGECEWLERGDAFPVFPTSVGTLGIFICWDIIFPEVTQCLAMNGANLLLQPTYGHAGAMADPMAQTRAHDAVCPLIVSMWNGASRIFDKDGSMLERGHRTRDWQGLIPHQILYADLDPVAPRRWIDMDDTRAALREQRQLHLYRPLVDPPADA